MDLNNVDGYLAKFFSIIIYIINICHHVHTYRTLYMITWINLHLRCNWFHILLHFLCPSSFFLFCVLLEFIYYYYEYTLWYNSFFFFRFLNTIYIFCFCNFIHRFFFFRYWQFSYFINNKRFEFDVKIFCWMFNLK